MSIDRVRFIQEKQTHRLTRHFCTALSTSQTPTTASTARPARWLSLDASPVSAVVLQRGKLCTDDYRTHRPGLASSAAPSSDRRATARDRVRSGLRRRLRRTAAVPSCRVDGGIREVPVGIRRSRGSRQRHRRSPAPGAQGCRAALQGGRPAPVHDAASAAQFASRAHALASSDDCRPTADRELLRPGPRSRLCSDFDRPSASRVCADHPEHVRRRPGVPLHAGRLTRRLQPRRCRAHPADQLPRRAAGPVWSGCDRGTRNRPVRRVRSFKAFARRGASWAASHHNIAKGRRQHPAGRPAKDGAQHPAARREDRHHPDRRAR